MIVLEVRVVAGDGGHDIHVLSMLAVVVVWIIRILTSALGSDHTPLSREILGATLR